MTLSKQQQASINAQLAEESKIRQRVTGIRANLQRGLNFVRSLVASGVDEFRWQISSVATLLLDGALRRGAMLVEQDAFNTYIVSHSLHASDGQLS